MKRIRIIPVLTAVLAVTLLLPEDLQAQGHYSPASLGMAGARGTLLKDIDAALVNPALLALPGRKAFSVRLFGVSSQVDQNFMSIGRWNDLQGELLTDSDKDRILDAMPSGGMVDGLVEVGSLGIQVGSWAFSSHTFLDLNATVPRDLFSIALRGTQVDRTYQMSETALEFESVTMLSLTHSFELPIRDAQIPLLRLPLRQLYGGVSLKYYMGHGYARMEEGRAELFMGLDGYYGTADFLYRTAGIPGGEIDDDNEDPRVLADTDYSSSPGAGFGFDVGVAGVISDNLSFHGALLNLSPGIKWSKSTYQTRITARADTLSIAGFLDIDFDEWKELGLMLEDEEDVEAYLDSLTSHDISFERRGSFRTMLPLILRVGGTYRWRRVALNAELEQALTRALGYNLVPRLALGFEFRPIGMFPIRAGLSMGGRLGLVGGFGLGLDLKALVWDISISNTGLTPGGFRGLGVATGLKISF